MAELTCVCGHDFSEHNGNLITHSYDKCSCAKYESFFLHIMSDSHFRVIPSQLERYKLGLLEIKPFYNISS